MTNRARRARELGLDRPIARRDFLNGIALTTGGMLVSPAEALGLDPEDAGVDAAAYPPALTGLRGNHEGTYDVAHSLKDGAFWQHAGPAEDSGEVYDLVVVGAGISGLAGAHFYRKGAGRGTRVLLLDNHDDFGGHAKRNEFRVGDRLLISYAGTQSIESPSRYSKVAGGLLSELGIDMRRFYSAFDQRLYASLGLGTGVFFDRETFGADRLVGSLGERPWPGFLAQAPLSEVARRDIARLYTQKPDYMPGQSASAKRARLAKLSYADFLTRIARAHADVLPFFQAHTHDLWGLGIDAVSALDCYEGGDDYGFGYPGFQGLGLDAERDAPAAEDEPYIFHFPDGNASIARLLLRALIPSAVPGHTMDDVVTARVGYARLDEPGQPVRIRLNSTVVRVRHGGALPAAREVEVAYVQGGRLRSVKARACILACWNGVIPYLCPELPEPQKQALAYGVKAPLVYTHVLIRNWTSFRALGMRQALAPGSYHSYVSLDFPVSLGAYRCPRGPEEPMVLFLLRAPCSPGLPAREQHRAGRVELLGTPFATFEQKIRDQLARMLGPAGFDPARDVLAITVNRWAHGYTYAYSTLWDPDWTESERPCVVGRQRFGRISIANADAGGEAYTDVAIDQADRAVQEILAQK